MPARQPSPRDGSRSPSKLVIGQWDWGFHTLQGGIDPAGFLCGFGLLELLRYGMISDLWMRTIPLQVRRDRGVAPKRNPRRALAPEASANQQSASGTGVFTPCGAVPTLGIYGYVPRLLEVYRYGWVPDTGMGTYYPRVRRDRGVCPRGNPRRAMAPEAPANW